MASESQTKHFRIMQSHHKERLVAMLEDSKGETWDLTPNDKAAIQAALGEAELSAIRRQRLEECYKLMSEQNQHIKNLELTISMADSRV